MCAPGKKFTLCTCKEVIIHHKNSRKHKNGADGMLPHFTWHLYRYTGTFSSGLDGMLMMPEHSLGTVFTDEEVQQELNSRQCFDFDYQPGEGDNLRVMMVQNKTRSSFFSFIFRNGQWAIAHYNSFFERTEEISHGKIKME
ncbi:hypothetical protein ACTHGU_00835 [Chitinophagaceae bacterium MMS25-I14]